MTESRQYRTHGLIHVSDQFFEFALELEQKRMNGLNSRMLKVHGDKLVEVVEAGLLNDQGLRLQWRDLFDSFDIMVRYNILIKAKIIYRIYKTVISCDKEQYDYFSFSIFSFIYIFSHISFTSLIKLILLKLFDPTVS